MCFQVRQLEAIIRISESLAKMRLLDEVHDEHVREAIRLFQVSTLAASKSGMIGESMGFVDSQTLEEITCVNLASRTLFAWFEQSATG